ncbi:MAG: hypothetical protein WAU32_12460 [Thermoanaerobaculia bacterium]|jgi:hypothetical protein
MRWKILLLTAALVCAAAVYADSNKFDKTIAFPRGGEVPLDWSYQKCTIKGVKVVNYPADFEIDKARREAPNDKANIGWEFSIDNRSSSKYEVHLSVEVLDKSGQVIKAGDRSPSVGAHSADTTKVSTKMRTVEAADAPKVRLRAEIVPK